jgi:cell division protein ZipA
VEFELRDWLLILGPVFVCAVLLHGYWRMRTNRNSLRMSLDKTYLSKTSEEGSVDDFSLLKAELPNGGARVIKKPEQTSLELAQDVPVLMEPVTDTADEQMTGDNTDAMSDDMQEAALEVAAEIAPEVSLEDNSLQPIRAGNTASETVSSAPAKAPPAQKVEVQHGDKPEKFIIVNVLADEGQFAGDELLNTLTSHGMTHGDMDIFHRLNDQSFSEFSLTNAVEPGTFDLSTLASEPTPGVTLFMRVHELADPIHVYDQMIEVAQAIAGELGGTVRDETRSVVTSQTIEHCRQGIRDFQYRHSA